jgi:arginase
VPVRRWSPDRESRRAQNVAGVVATIDEVREAVAESVAGGERALVLGGDCTVGLGTIAALGDPGVVYLDLHADMNVPSSTVDGAGRNVGVPLASALEALTVLLGDPRVAALTVTELNPLHAEAEAATLERFVDGLVGACAGWGGRGG